VSDPRTTRTEAMTIACPFCGAQPERPCEGARGKLRASVHAERHLAALDANRKATVRELRAYDVEPEPVPIAYQREQPPSANEARGRVVHRLDDHTRAVGLAGVAAARAILAGHRHHLRLVEDEEP
jgi:hypothetical protein